MRVGIISDTHNELTRTHKAIQMLRDEGAGALIHCGDLSSPAIVEVCSALPCWFALGNHDADNVPALEQAPRECGVTCLGWTGTIELAGKRIAVAHGHMTYDIRLALKGQPHYLVSGHSHIASDRYEGLVRRINPGSLFEAEQYTAALLDLESDELRFLTVPPA